MTGGTLFRGSTTGARTDGEKVQIPVLNGGYSAWTDLREDTSARFEQPGQIDKESRGEAGVVSVAD